MNKKMIRANVIYQVKGSDRPCTTVVFCDEGTDEKAILVIAKGQVKVKGAHNFVFHSSRPDNA